MFTVFDSILNPEGRFRGGSAGSQDIRSVSNLSGMFETRTRPTRTTLLGCEADNPRPHTAPKYSQTTVQMSLRSKIPERGYVTFPYSAFILTSLRHVQLISKSKTISSRTTHDTGGQREKMQRGSRNTDPCPTTLRLSIETRGLYL